MTILTITDMQELAKQRGGKCLSKKYVNDKTNYKWECLKGHTWTAMPKHIKQGTWCPYCTEFKTENICRDIIEGILKIKFPTKKPKWLNGLELDGYNKEHKIAFEYNGEQHYKEHNFFHKTKNQFKEQQQRDKLKIKLCKENNVKLIIIPYTIKIDKLYEYIKKELAK